MTRFSIIIISLLMSACAVHEDTYYRNLEANKHFASLHYLHDVVKIPTLGVVIDFKDTHGFIERSLKSTSYNYGKSIDKSRWHTAAIIIHQISPPRIDFENEKVFFQELKTNLEILRAKNGNNIEFSVTSDKKKGSWCVLYHNKEYLKNQKDAPGKLFIYDRYEYICKHLHRSNIFLNLSYSERYASGEGVSNARVRAEKMLEKINLVK